MKLRCNTIVDCPFDEGDETNCAKVLLTETYNSDAAPNTGVKINGDYTVNKVRKVFHSPLVSLLFSPGDCQCVFIYP